MSNTKIVEAPPAETSVVTSARSQLDALLLPENIIQQQETISHELGPFVDEDGSFMQDRADDVQFISNAIIKSQIDIGDASEDDRKSNTRYFWEELKAQYYRAKENSIDPPRLHISVSDPVGQNLVCSGESQGRPNRDQIFISTHAIGSIIGAADDNRAGRLTISDINTQHRGETSISVGRLIGSSAPFSSWISGYENGGKVEPGDPTGKEQDSAEKIRDYASRPTPIPSLDHAIGFVTHDGCLYYVADGGAHRAAAAIMKGQDRIGVKTLVIMPVNMTSAEIESMAS